MIIINIIIITYEIEGGCESIIESIYNRCGI